MGPTETVMILSISSRDMTRVASSVLLLKQKMLTTRYWIGFGSLRVSQFNK